MREPSGGLQPPARPARNAYIQMENKSGKIKEVKLWVNTRIRAAVTTVKKRCENGLVNWRQSIRAGREA